MDLLREVFGPVGPHGATRELFARELSDEVYSAPIATGVRQLVAAMSQRRNDITNLAVRFGSDEWGGRLILAGGVYFAYLLFFHREVLDVEPADYSTATTSERTA